MNEISKKKQQYKVISPLRKYLKAYNRDKDLPLGYADLVKFKFAVPVYDKTGKDTLWETVFFDETTTREIHRNLALIYALLKTEGDNSALDHLYISRIDYCTFGNSNPFRIRIVNNLNDNYDYFYIKTADASRLYGLELEHILSPNRINYITRQNTLIEEHIAGIPGDQFILNNLNDKQTNKTRLAKEFVKFNERCFIRLLGDMRSYNYVIDITPDFDDVQYRIRAIDFDQQSYEGRKNLYFPQYYKENNALIELCSRLLTSETLKQYQKEEQTLISRRLKSAHHRLKDLLDVMAIDEISTPDKVNQLKHELADHYQNASFTKSHGMGEILRKNLNRLLGTH